MKITFFLLNSIFFCISATAQDDEVRSQSLNSFFIEFYQPIQNNIREFQNEDWILSYPQISLDKYSRNYSTLAFGLGYSRLFKNDIFLRIRAGISKRWINEGNDAIENNEQNSNQLIENYDYDQEHYNLFFGVGKRLKLHKHLAIELGLDFAYVNYQKGIGDHHYSFTQVDNATENIYIQDIHVHTEIGKAQSYGMGPLVNFELTIYKNLFASAEMQIFFTRTVASDNSKKLETSTNIQNGETSEEISIENVIDYDVNQWNWTKISPLLRLGYRF